MAELGRDLVAVLDRVRRRGDSFLIEQDGEAVAILEPMETAGNATWRTLSKVLRDLPNDDLDFADDLTEIQRNQPEMPASAWPN